MGKTTPIFCQFYAQNQSYNGVIAPGQSITIEFVGTVEGKTFNTYDVIRFVG